MKRPYEVSIGPGWRPMVEPLVRLCESHGGTIHQIKEKFGTLRFYYEPPSSHNDPDFWHTFEYAVRAVESRSARICEESGAPGRLYTMDINGKPRWARTLSPEVAAKLGYALRKVEHEEP